MPDDAAGTDDAAKKIGTKTAVNQAGRSHSDLQTGLFLHILQHLFIEKFVADLPIERFIQSIFPGSSGSIQRAVH